MHRIINRLNKSYLPMTTLALTMIAANSATAASVTFAQYFQANGALQAWSVTTSTSGATTTTTVSVSALPVTFLFSGVSPLPFSGPEAAMFNFSASSTQIGNCGLACANNDSFGQQGYAGTFSFIDDGGGSAQGSNLLSGTIAVTGSPAITGGTFGSSLGSGAASFRASADTGNLLQLVLTSHYLNFIGQTQESASFSLSSLIPNFAVGPISNGDQAFPAPGTFNASGSGTFSSNPGPVSLTPEPGSLFLALIGFGLCGIAFVTRRRYNLPVVTPGS